MFGNLLTLPIGDSGLLYVEPLYVQGTGQNSFPLLQKVLVNYADRVGYADTLPEALDQVFGAGAGDDGDRQRHDAAPADGATPTPTTRDADHEPAGRRHAASSPAMDQAVADIDAALTALTAAQSSGDFAGPGPGAGRPAEGRHRLPVGAEVGSASASPTRLTRTGRGSGAPPLPPPPGWYGGVYRRGVEQLGSSLGS